MPGLQGEVDEVPGDAGQLLVLLHDEARLKGEGDLILILN